MGLLNKSNINKINKMIDDDTVFVIYPCRDDFAYMETIDKKRLYKVVTCEYADGVYVFVSTKSQLVKYIKNLEDTWTDVFQSILNVEDTIEYINDSRFDPESYDGKDKVFKVLAGLNELKEIINK